MKVVREIYLRDDIPCCISGCEKCSSFEGYRSVFYIDQVIPLLDTNVLLHQSDVIPHLAAQSLTCSTAMEECKANNPKAYEKIRSISNLHVFSNEHHRETHVSPLKNQSIESPNDRNDRAIRQVAIWYSQHFPGTKVVLVTDDLGNRELSKEFEALSTRAFIQKYTGKPELLDLLAANESLAVPNNSFIYPAHWEPAHARTAIDKGLIFKGNLHISPYNVLEAFIHHELHDKITILGRKAMNRALQGDTVAVELVKEPIGFEEMLLEEESEECEPESPLRQTQSMPTNQKYGRIVCILKRALKPLAGSIVQKQNSPTLFIPADRRFPSVIISVQNASALADSRIIASIDSWPASSKYPLGHYHRSLGTAGLLSTETEALLIDHEIAYCPFSKAVLDCLPVEGANWKASPEEEARRADFRDLDVCSIDPPGCTDIDDALHARPLPNGLWEVGVHIADVTHFVLPSTPMDLEASKRATSVYLVDRRIDMLPELLGSDLCSLHQHVDRLAFSVIFIFDQSNNIIDRRYCKSIIRSKASFTYDQAQAILDNDNDSSPIARSIKQLAQIARRLRAQRMHNGALTLASPEVKFQLSEENKDPLDIEVKKMQEANSLIEEFMLLANVAVAEKIYSSFPEHAVLRRHSAPAQSAFDSLRSALEQRGFTLDTSSSKALSDSLDLAVDPSDEYFNSIVRILTTRCMMQAVYFASGTVPQQEFKHYGLAMPIYTHFTSPIRRYSDVMVHRLLWASLTPGEHSMWRDLTLTKSAISDICDNLNYRHRMAQYASRASTELYTHLYFKGKGGIMEEQGYVIKVTRNGFVVFVPKYGIEGVVTLGPLQGSVEFLEVENLLVKQGVEWIKLFQKVMVNISVVEKNTRSKLVVTLVE